MSQYIACGRTKIAAIAITAMVARDPTSGTNKKIMEFLDYFLKYRLPRLSKLNKFPISPKFPPMIELIPLSGMDRNGTVNVRPSWNN